MSPRSPSHVGGTGHRRPAPLRTGSRSELLARSFRGLGHPNRLRIVEALRTDEHPVGELATQLGLTQPQVSLALNRLRACGLVEARREHRHVHYRIHDARVLAIVDLAYSLLADNARHRDLCPLPTPTRQSPPSNTTGDSKPAASYSHIRNRE